MRPLMPPLVSRFTWVPGLRSSYLHRAVISNGRRSTIWGESIRRMWNSYFSAIRKGDVILTLLRIGHTHLAHGHVLRGEPAPVCTVCGTVLPLHTFLLNAHVMTKTVLLFVSTTLCVTRLATSAVASRTCWHFQMEHGLTDTVLCTVRIFFVYMFLWPCHRSSIFYCSLEEPF